MSRHTMRYEVAGVVLRYLVIITAMVTATEVSAQDTTRAPTASTLKRIAEAVDGYTGGGRVYVVVDSGNVASILTSRFDADTLAKRLRGEVHGPFTAPPGPISYLPSRCVHRASMMLGYCNKIFPRIRLDDIKTITLTIALKSGPTRTINLPTDADAIFLSGSSYDKFVFPYYARVYGVSTAASMRQEILFEGKPEGRVP